MWVVQIARSDTGATGVARKEDRGDGGKSSGGPRTKDGLDQGATALLGEVRNRINGLEVGHLSHILTLAHIMGNDDRYLQR